MKARNPSTGNLEKVYVKALDSMPVGAEIDFDGQASDIPTGWEQVDNVVSSINAVSYTEQSITNTGTTITDMTTTITTTGKPLVVNFSVPVRAGGAGSPQLRIVIDGTTKKQYVMSITTNVIASYTAVFTDIEPGQHTVRIDGSKGNDNALAVLAFTDKALNVYEI